MIDFKCSHLDLPLSYKHALQAMIYNILDYDQQSTFYHDQGYTLEDKSYKMFVFSDLLGVYEVKGKRIIFEEQVKLYIDAMDAAFTQSIYNFLQNNKYIYLLNQRLEINSIMITNTPVFKGEQSIVVQSLSPVVAYTTKDKYVTYYKPTDKEFTSLVRNNIIHKCEAYHYPASEVVFEVEEVSFMRKRIVSFKHNFYEAYQCQLKIHVNYDTFKIIYETGLSAKGSTGFGMIYMKA